MSERVVPLIINGNDVVLADEASQFLSNGQMKGSPMWKVQGATPALCKEALQSSEAAFPVWRRTKPFARQNLIRKVADVCVFNLHLAHACVGGCCADYVLASPCSDRRAGINPGG